MNRFDTQKYGKPEGTNQKDDVSIGMYRLKTSRKMPNFQFFVHRK